MNRSLTPFVDNLCRGRLSRRQFLTVAAAAMAVPGSAFAQQPSGATAPAATGAAGRGQAAVNAVTPLVPPFEATGWKTVWLDHLSYQCVDYKKAASFYATLMGWKIRSDDGKQAVLDIGENTGGMIIRGGFTGPAPAALTDSGLGPNRPVVQAVYDGFAWGIDPWDTDKVKAELDKRGLNPVADHQGSDYRCFHVKDPDGFDLAITNGTKALRRKGPANGKLTAAAPFEATGWNTLYLDHISFEVADYSKSAAFYQALLGWTMRPAAGSVNVQIGDIAGGIIRPNVAAAAAARGSRGGSSSNGAAPPPPPPPARPVNGVTGVIGHISFGIENWDTQRVHDELTKLDVVYINAQGQHEPRPDNTGSLLSFHVPDAMGWDLQIGNKIAGR